MKTTAYFVRKSEFGSLFVCALRGGKMYQYSPMKDVWEENKTKMEILKPGGTDAAEWEQTDEKTAIDTVKRSRELYLKRMAENS